jgi:hypothetical protein
MATRTPGRTEVGVIPKPAFGVAGKIAVAGLVLLGVGALAGGFALASKPDGSVMQFDLRLLAGSPFSDYFIPGLILGGLFGIGCAQMNWIVAELVTAQASTIAARSAWPAGTVLDWIHVVRVERSSSLTASAADGMCPSSHLCQRTNDARH